MKKCIVDTLWLGLSNSLGCVLVGCVWVGVSSTVGYSIALLTATTVSRCSGVLDVSLSWVTVGVMGSIWFCGVGVVATIDVCALFVHGVEGVMQYWVTNLACVVFLGWVYVVQLAWLWCVVVFGVTSGIAFFFSSTQ